MRLNLHRISLFLMSLLPAAMYAQQSLEPIRLTFEGVGESKLVESVKVDNLTKGTTLTLSGNDILVLSGEATGIEDVEGGAVALTRPLIYPNPAQTDANLVFDAPEAGKVSIKIYNTGGALVDAADINVAQGRNAVRIPTQGYGFFIVRVDGVGIHYSYKWMSGAPKSGSRIEHIGMSTRELPTVAPLATRATLAATQESKEMQFNAGDVLRFTGKSGDMTTIVVRKPTLDHTVSFQFFKCQDANGYNYPIVEAGGMLWMAEDLRPVKGLEGISISKNATQWKDPKANPLRMAYADFNDNNSDKGAYYTPKAAVKALPAGWKLPTADELKLVQQTFGGADSAAMALKTHGDDSDWGAPSYAIDEVQLNLGATGMLQADGQFSGLGSTATVVTRNFTNGLAHIMNMRDGSNATELKLGLTANAGEAFTVRGVRPAMSAYNGFISNWLSEHPEDAPKSINLNPVQVKAGLAGNPFAYTAPLGQKYTITSGVDQIAIGSSLYNNKSENLASFTYVSGQDQYLNRIVGQNMPNGLQRAVRISWSNMSYTYSNNAKQQWADRYEHTKGPGTLNIEVLGNASEPDFKYKGVIDKGFNFRGVKNFYPYASCCFGYIVDFNTEYQNTFRNYEQLITSLTALCADYNGDGIDDIVTGIGSKVVIIDGANYKQTLFEKDFGENNPSCLKVSCAVGDINKDGQSDLAVIYEKNEGSVLQVWWNGVENFGGKPNYNGTLGMAQEGQGVLIGDIDDNGNPDVICQVYNKNEQEISIFSYNNKYDQLDVFTSKKFTVKDLRNGEMSLIRAKGLVKAPFLLACGKVYEWNMLDQVLVQHEKDIELYSGLYCVGNFGDDQSGKELLCRWSPTIVSNNGLNNYPFWTYQGQYVIEEYKDSSKTFIYKSYANNFATRTISLGSPYGHAGDFTNFMTVAPIRYKNPIREAELSSIETTMSEPRIYALLSAPPFWGDYQGKYAENGGTSWGKTKSSGGGTSQETSSTGSMIAGFEKEFSLPFIGNIGGVDFETRLDWTSSQSQQKTTMTEYGIEYNTIWQDAVVLTLVPYTTYNYVITKSGNEDEIGSTLMVGMPDKPRTMLLGLDNYMELRADNAAIPNLRELLQHKPGNPWSYKAKYVDAMPVTSDILWGGGEKGDFITTGSAGNTTRTIAVTTEMESTNENEFAMDVTLVGNVLGVKAGGGYGYSNKNGIIHKQEVGMEVSGTVPTPDDIKEVKAFQWNMCRANVLFCGQKFPVVTYIVQQ